MAVEAELLSSVAKLERRSLSLSLTKHVKAISGGTIRTTFWADGRHRAWQLRDRRPYFADQMRSESSFAPPSPVSDKPIAYIHTYSTLLSFPCVPPVEASVHTPRSAHNVCDPIRR